MKGELGIKAKYIVLNGHGNNCELSIHCEDGGFLHLVGDNDWRKLFKDAIKDDVDIYNGLLVEVCFNTFNLFP